MTQYERTVFGAPIGGGFDVIVAKAMGETDVYWFPKARKVFCGNVAHLKYEITKAQVRIDIRADLERQLDAFAKRVGVDRSTTSE